ncbi:TetR/AcrR family transcriptional regulator [Luteibacter sp. 3190]|uniref:TetR/AcrR family transcriptional regulator n=1 Tax=Luteibacter sp. 3190 TaxID=2817736 RepID=UPI0028673F33|nr:TetR/AcrR family transcriptional regulator [Luteibacter sp. 3190]MDR6937883.1 AcrR family transcriptional regulator [Luteibacter sp. 3190]
MPRQPKSPAARRGRPVTFDRDAVLERAMRVFWAKGFAATSMNDLIGAMEIASPSLYAAFGSKAGLYRAAVDRYVALHADLVSGAMALPTARDSVEALLRNAVTVFSRTDFPSGCMVEQTAGEAGDLPPDVEAGLRALREANNENFSARLRKGIADGDVLAGTDIAAVAAFYATVYRGLSLSARGGTTTDELHSVVASAMAAWPLVTAARS